MLNTANTAQILPPYYDDVGLKRRRIVRYSQFTALLLFCFLYGFAFALLAPFLMMFFTVPLAFIAGLIIWALPDVRHPPLKLLNTLFFGFIVTMWAWPSYLAIALPGLPWINFVRLFSTPLAITLLVCLSVSQPFRQELKSILSAAPIIPIALGLFVLAQAFSMLFSNKIYFSLNRFVIDQVNWTAMYFVSCFLFTKPGRAERWAAVMWGLALFLCMLGLIENKIGHVPWQGHVPGFLRMDSDLVDGVTKGASRAYVGVHRVGTIFTTSLTFSEFLALSTPLVLHFAWTPRPVWIRLAAAATVPLLGYMAILTQSRSGLIGVGLSTMLYVLAWAVMRRSRGGGLVSTAVVVAYPVLFAVAIACTIFIGRIRHKVWGGGEHASSNFARTEQYGRGIPMVFTHPFGHGIGRGGEALGFYLPSGLLTIDTYYLEVALDYGIFGFLIYYTMIYSGIFYGARYAQRPAQNREYSLLIAGGLLLLNFAVINSVFSELDNHPLAFVALGLISALVYRVRNERLAEGDIKTPERPIQAAKIAEAQRIRPRTPVLTS